MRARDNPFRADRVEQIRYRLEDATWPELLERCATLGYQAAVIGPPGFGKTTFLSELEPRLRTAGFGTWSIRLDQDQRAFAPGFLPSLFARLTARDILLVDEAQQMNPLAWRHFRRGARHAGGLIIATHRGGRLPTLWECRTSPELLAGIAAELLQVNRDTLQMPVTALYRKHRGNLRSVLREWYDVAASQSGFV